MRNILALIRTRTEVLFQFRDRVCRFDPFLCFFPESVFSNHNFVPCSGMGFQANQARNLWAALDALDNAQMVSQGFLGP
jgi:hypothetical protein